MWFRQRLELMLIRLNSLVLEKVRAWNKKNKKLNYVWLHPFSMKGT